MDNTDVTPPKPVDMDVLEKLHSEARERVVARQKARKTGGRVPVRREPLRHQQKGPIVAGPSAWVVCTICTRLFSTPDDPTARYGTRKRHAARHLADHRAGRIRRPETTDKTDSRDARRAEKKAARRAAAR